jgi:predicted nucleotidyltransferase
MRHRLLEVAVDKCEYNNARLIYLAEAGSHRFGSSTDKSDFDAEGIFVPSRDNMLIGNIINTIDYKSEKDERNYDENLDIKLYSIQYFLKYLLCKCDGNALDILYSHTNKESVLYKDKPIDEILENKDKLFSINSIMGFPYVKFSVGQVKKYGIKSDKLSVLKKVYNYLIDIESGEYFENMRLRDISDDLLEVVNNEDLLFLTNDEKTDFLVLCGKSHQLSIYLREFKNRITSAYLKYGDRTKKSCENGGLDWKAISNSVRALHQMKELCTTGNIEFPLSIGSFIRDIKLGMHSVSYIEEVISKQFEDLNEISIKDIKFKGKRDESFIDSIILKSYK